MQNSNIERSVRNSDMLRSVPISKSKWKTQLWIASSFANRWKCRLLFKLQEQKEAVSYQSILSSTATIVGKPLLVHPNAEQNVQIVGCIVFTLFSVSSAASVLLLLTLCPLTVWRLDLFIPLELVLFWMSALCKSPRKLIFCLFYILPQCLSQKKKKIQFFLKKLKFTCIYFQISRYLSYWSINPMPH